MTSEERAQLVARIATLRLNAAKGIKTASYDGNSVTFIEPDKALDVATRLERMLNPMRRVHYPTFERGT